MRKHFDNDGVRNKACLTLWIAESNIQTGDGKYFFAGEIFHIDYDVGGTDPSLTLSHSLTLSLSHSLSLSACSGSAREGRSWKQSKSEREREMWSERRSVVIRFTADNSFQWQTSLFPMNIFVFLFIL